MVPGLTERMKLAAEFPDAIERMKRCLGLKGFVVSDDDVVWAWSHYSDSLCANWLNLPDSDEDLRSILVKHLPSDRARSEISAVTRIPVEGSHEDMWLLLPNDVTRAMGWAIGDTVEVTKSADCLVLRRVTYRTDSE